MIDSAEMQRQHKHARSIAAPVAATVFCVQWSGDSDVPGMPGTRSGSFWISPWADCYCVISIAIVQIPH